MGGLFRRLLKSNALGLEDESWLVLVIPWLIKTFCDRQQHTQEPCTGFLCTHSLVFFLTYFIYLTPIDTIYQVDLKDKIDNLKHNGAYDNYVRAHVIKVE